MKKEKLVLKCSQEEFYNAVIQDFKNQYTSIKEKELADEKIVPGFSFTKKLPMKRNQTKLNVAKYRVLECLYPQKFVMEYLSQTYHKVISAEIKEYDNEHIEVLFGSFDEKLKEGIKPTRHFGEDVIVSAKLKTKMSMKSMLKNYRKIQAEEDNKNDINEG